MDKEKAWRPHMGRLPLFNPFESSTKQTDETRDGDEVEIEIEDEAATEDSQSPGSTAGKEDSAK